MLNVLNISFKTDFEQDLDNIYREYLEEAGIDFKERKSAFFQYMNANDRLITPQPRQVYEASVLKIPEKLKENYEKLKQKIINGENINAYQSTKLHDSSFIDKLFTFENLVHFHLGGEIELHPKFNRMYMERTGDLIVGLVKENSVYFLEIKPHHKDTWLNKSYLEILSKEFPEAIEDKKLHMTDGDEFNYTLIDNLRRISMNYAIKTENGNVYTNTPVVLTRDNVRLKHVIMKDQLMTNIKGSAEEIKQSLRENKIPGHYQIKLRKIVKHPDSFIYEISKDNQDYQVVHIAKDKMIIFK